MDDFTNGIFLCTKSCFMNTKRLIMMLWAFCLIPWAEWPWGNHFRYTPVALTHPLHCNYSMTPCINVWLIPSWMFFFHNLHAGYTLSRKLGCKQCIGAFWLTHSGVCKFVIPWPIPCSMSDDTEGRQSYIDMLTALPEQDSGLLVLSPDPAFNQFTVSGTLLRKVNTFPKLQSQPISLNSQRKVIQDQCCTCHAFPCKASHWNAKHIIDH